MNLDCIQCGSRLSRAERQAEAHLRCAYAVHDFGRRAGCIALAADESMSPAEMPPQIPGDTQRAQRPRTGRAVVRSSWAYYLGRTGQFARFVCFISLDLWYDVVRDGS